MTRARVACGALAFGAFAALVVAKSASASTGYPPEMQKYLTISSAPKCEVCHEQADGGPTDTPFAKSMTARGMKGGGDLASLDAALDAMKRDRVDSDGDGAFDLDELAYGGDPNHADKPEGAPGPAPTYGCSMGSRVGAGEIGIAIGIVVVGVGRARRRERR